MPIEGPSPSPEWHSWLTAGKWVLHSRPTAVFLRSWCYGRRQRRLVRPCLLVNPGREYTGGAFS